MNRFFLLIICLTPFFLLSQNQISEPHSYLSADGTLFVNEHYKLNWSSPEEGTIYHFKWNDDPWLKYSEPIFPPNQGWNEIHYYAEDKLGNLESEKQINLFVDKTPPKINLIWKSLPKFWQDIAIAQATNEIKVRTIDEESGVYETFISFDGGELVRVTQGQDWILPTKEEGRHTLTVFATDNVKNTSRKFELRWLVDSSAPVLTVSTTPNLIGDNDKPICVRNTKIVLNAKDVLTETKDYLWRVKGSETWNASNRLFDLEKTFPYTDVIQLEFKARDFSGNESVPIFFQCMIDRKSPETQIKIQK